MVYLCECVTRLVFSASVYDEIVHRERVYHEMVFCLRVLSRDCVPRRVYIMRWCIWESRYHEIVDLCEGISRCVAVRAVAGWM